MDPLDDDVAPALHLVHSFALRHLRNLNTMRAATAAEPLPPVELPEVGLGALEAVERLIERYGSQFSGSPGPRYWGFVNGGVTPAALAGDWLCSVVDQNAQLNGDGAGAYIEHEALGMLRDLFELPQTFDGAFVTGGTMANYVGLATALQGLGSARGVDLSNEGLAALGPVRIVTGEGHSSIAKSAAMLGLGRRALTKVPRLPNREAVDADAMELLLQKSAGAAIIIVANAGTVLTGDFDDIARLADLAKRFGAHLHVDGAFGAFAVCTETHRHLVAGMERADSIASDGHKFLNVPFDSGFIFTKSLPDQIELFKNVSTYQSPPRLDPRHYIHLTPQNSRRLRALPAWISLYAYGEEGYRAIIERCCRLASLLGKMLQENPRFRLLSPVHYNVVCFQLLLNGRPASADETGAFLERVRNDGRVFVSPGNLRGTPCVRLAIVNWRTREADIGVALQSFVDCLSRPL